MNSNNIVDISGVGMRQFWNLKNHMQDASVLATAHYPETLDRIFVSAIPFDGPSINTTLIQQSTQQIIGAPSFFPTVWGWVKRWFDPVTVSKIFILSNHEIKTRLSDFIDPDDIPKKYGGNLDWEFGMQPNLDQAAQEAVEKNGSRGWIPGPCLWEQNQRVPVGTENGKPRRPAMLQPVAVPALTPRHTKGTQPPASTEPVTSPVSAATAEIQAETALRETSSPPSMAHSGSTASTFTSPSPETTSVLPVNGAVNVLDSDGPIVSNGEVIPSGDVKPPMERFVTAAEELHTVRPQANGTI